LAEPELIHQAYRFTLAPTREQAEFLESCAGASRFWFNQGLALVKARLEARASEGPAPSTSVPWSYNALCSAIPAARRWQLAPWQGEVVCGSYMAGFEALGKALQNFSGGRKEGRKVGFPNFRAKGRCQESILFQEPKLLDGRHVQLDRRLGPLRSKERLRKLVRLLASDPHARVMRSTVQRVGNTWFISFTVERSPKARHARRPQAATGVDVGLERLATISTGEFVQNARHLQQALGKLRRLQRKLDRQRRANNPGNYNPDGTSKAGIHPWVKSAHMLKTEERVRRVHTRVANLRRNQAHELTTCLTREYGVIGVEDLAVKNLMRNRRLARHIADVGWRTILTQLKYKTDWTQGSLLVEADWFYPSSKTCSGCRAVRAKLRHSERVYVCANPQCGLVMNRDHNAAINLAHVALLEAQEQGLEVHVAGIETETLNVRGGHVRLGRPAVKQSPVKREESTDSPQHREMPAIAA
jgi:putative transposase